MESLPHYHSYKSCELIACHKRFYDGFCKQYPCDETEVYPYCQHISPRDSGRWVKRPDEYNPYSHKRSECRGDDKYPWRTPVGYMGPHDEDYENI